MRKTSLLCFSLLTVIFSFSQTAADNSIEHNVGDYDDGRAIIDWVNQTHGGFVSRKLEIRRQDPTDPSSPLGVFATQDIEPDEMVLSIPKQLYISVPVDGKTASTAPDDISLDHYYSNVCRVVQRLREELRIYREKPEQSKYAPYLHYLETQPKGQLPATYSNQAKEILRNISGTRSSKKSRSPNYGDHLLPPWQLVDWIDTNFVETGCIAEDDPDAYHTVALTVQRGFDFELVPLWDMVNHDNGRLNLRTNSLRDPEGLKVWSSKSIAAGQELFATYNYCTDCNDIGYEWGTPAVYRDFGFVEAYPQDWAFWDHSVYFELTYNNEEQLAVSFDQDPDTGEIYDIPDEAAMSYFREQLFRLQQISVKEKISNLPKHEATTITQYYNTLTTALSSIVEEIKGDSFSWRKEL